MRIAEELARQPAGQFRGGTARPSGHQLRDRRLRARAARRGSARLRLGPGGQTPEWQLRIRPPRRRHSRCKPSFPNSMPTKSRSLTSTGIAAWSRQSRLSARRIRTAPRAVSCSSPPVSPGLVVGNAKRDARPGSQLRGDLPSIADFLYVHVNPVAAGIAAVPEADGRRPPGANSEPIKLLGRRLCAPSAEAAVRARRRLRRIPSLPPGRPFSGGFVHGPSSWDPTRDALLSHSRRD
jgi:hypothetical protein